MQTTISDKSISVQVDRDKGMLEAELHTYGTMHEQHQLPGLTDSERGVPGFSKYLVQDSVRQHLGEYDQVLVSLPRGSVNFGGWTQALTKLGFYPANSDMLKHLKTDTVMELLGSQFSDNSSIYVASTERLLRR